VGILIGVSSLYLSTGKLKTSSDYASCQRALNNADGGVDRIVKALIDTPDTNQDGIYTDAPPSTLDAYQVVKVYDIDNDGINDFNQLFAQNKNIPDITSVSSADAITLFANSDQEAEVWVEANQPSPGQATIYSSATHGRCKKTVVVIIEAFAGANTPDTTKRIGSPLLNAPPNT